MHPERQRRVVLSLLAETVIPPHDDKALGEFSDGVDDVSGFEVARLSSVNVEDLERILDDSVEIHWQEMRFARIRAREDKLPEKSAVFNKLVEFLVRLDLKLQRAII